MSQISSDTTIVTASQMRQIEEIIFEKGMPVAALMEKAAGLIAQYIQEHYSKLRYSKISVIVGSGHNGGDALVVARELHFAGYQVQIYRPLEKSKPLTQQHLDYANFLEIQEIKNIEGLLVCDLLIDGLFGFGLEREITGELADLISVINQAKKTVISIDLPSGIHTDTGAVLGQAIQATKSLCLGLWKRAYFQDQAIPYLGQTIRLDFGIPQQSLEKISSNQSTTQPIIQSFTQDLAQTYFPLRRSPLIHKYQQGHLLLIGGSQTYAGSILLSALGARATGVGMLTIVAPESLKLMLVAQMPEALVIGCPETATGAIQTLPDLDFTRYQAIACGCGLTATGANNILPSLITAEAPLILDADALNWLANDNLNPLQNRKKSTHNPTILTPHFGEFKRLFPGIKNTGDRLTMNQQASELSETTILFKGAKSIITQPNGDSYCLMESTPALARGGSGDVLLGTMGGLLAQCPKDSFEIAATAAWWHAQAGILAAQEQTLAGVDGVTLSQYLLKYLSK